MNHKKLFIGGAVILVVLAAYFIFKPQPPKDVGLATSSFVKYTGDVIGTKNGTTTTAVGFYGNHTATTTYVSKIGAANEVAYAFQIKNASSSADVQLSILASNDDFCDTATSSTIYDVVTMSQINWFDAAPFLDMHAAQTLTNGTSTINWNTSNGAGTGRTLLFNNLSARCLALQVNASSTEIRAELSVR